MEEGIEVDLTATIANCRKQQKRNVRGKAKKKTTKGRTKEREEVVAGDTENLPGAVGGLNEGPPGITISVFDYSVEEHFRAVDMISKLCGEECEFDQSEIERLNSSVTFLREWRHFNYQPKVIRFACQSESTQGKDVIGGINLPQFSSATVPKKDRQNGSTLSSESSKDFIMHVGGSVWALDWCPRIHQSSDCEITSEFIAVATHPPESSYHKIGAPLTGRGVIQIWCLLNASMKKDVPQVKKKPKQNPRKSDIIKDKSTQQQKPRGRPKKKPTVESVDNSDGNNHLVEAIAVQFPDDSSKLVLTDGLSEHTQKKVARKDSGRPRNGGTIRVKSAQPQKPKGRPRKKPTVESVDNLDGNNHLMQAIAVQFPDDSSKLVLNDGLSGDIQERVANKHSGRKQKDSSQSVSVEPKQDPRKGVKRSIIESEDNLVGNNQYVQAIPVQFHDDSSKLLLTDGVSGDTQETLAKNDSGIKRKGSSQAVSAEPKQDPRNSETTKVKSTKTQRPRGRPRKKTINEFVENLDLNHQYEKALVVQFPENSSELLPIDAVSRDTYEQVAKRYSGRKQKNFSQGVSEYSALTPSAPSRLKGETRTGGHFHGNGLPLSKQNDKPSHVNSEMSSSCNLYPVVSSENVANNGSLETSPAKYSIPKDVALPRVVLCLAHNGKVAWDVKWRPSDVCESKHRMGYLAVLLGNGALEVWEVPSPRAIKVIYSACQKEGIDPRFVKLEPVFRCSMLKCGDRLSIPLTVEWSASSPHDLILAGCHDGVVALWKFSTNGSSKDTRPLLCFSADTVPIRALAWAPVESDPESANVIVTAGHKGLKFWDIRDPFRPLWDLNPVQRVIYSLDWLPDPRCVIVSFDDGTLRVLSLSKAAYDVPVTGQPFIGTQQQGLHSYYCSSFTIWSVQVSRLTGMVAYCSADGTVLRFQLTTKAVEKDPLRNRAPHFLCGSIASDEESALTVITPLPDIPFPMKKSLNEWGNAPRTIRGFLSVSNQEKRAKEQMAKGQMSDEQPLALCYGDDPGVEFGSDDTLVAQKNKQAPKTKITNKKKLKTDQALVCRNEDPGNVQTEECDKVEVENEIEVFPPKIVAMHRVRWNMNKGSGRWLCYGGEGGIVRCQEI